MKTVDELITDILRREGGFVNDPNDRGGATNWGITQSTLAEWRDHPVSVDEVRKLSRDEAREIYRKVYFESAGIGDLPTELQAQAFDINVNGGLKPILARLTSYFGATLAEIVEFLGPKTANIMLAASRVEYYRQITNNRPANKTFLLGWLNRASEFTEW